jgi:hypothetical protein
VTYLTDILGPSPYNESVLGNYPIEHFIGELNMKNENEILCTRRFNFDVEWQGQPRNFQFGLKLTKGRYAMVKKALDEQYDAIFSPDYILTALQNIYDDRENRFEFTTKMDLDKLEGDPRSFDEIKMVIFDVLYESARANFFHEEYLRRRINKLQPKAA